MDPHATPGITITRRPALAPRQDVALDVAAFVGLTERGPVNQAVLLTSWDAFVRSFGHDDDVRQLPRCVRAFFDNGGRRCLVVRTVHTSNDASQEQARAATTRLPGVHDALDPARISYLEAADPGAWGRRLVGVVRTLRRRTSPRFDTSMTLLTTDPNLAPGVVLHLERWSPQDQAWVRGTRLIVEARQGLLTLDAPLEPAWVSAGTLLAQVEHLTWELDVSLDGEHERHVALELGPQHPRFVDKVLRRESRWVHFQNPPLASYFVADPRATPSFDFGLPYLDAQGHLEPLGGADGASALTRSDFFAATRALEHYEDGGPAVAARRLELYPRDAALLAPDRGHALAPASMVHLSDWMHPRDPDLAVALEPADSPETTLTFAPCEAVVPPRPPQSSLPMYPHLALAHGTRPALEALDPWRAWCAGRHALLLVDLPPGSDAERLERWRRSLDSTHVALFGPWLHTGRAGALGRRLLPPAAPVCGLLGRLEGLAGVGTSPGNQDVAGALGLVADARQPAASVSFALRLNRLEQTPSGLRLMGSRTVGGSERDGHISVQRVLAWLYRQLPQDAAWAVFEPQGPRLWHRLERQVAARLRSLFLGGWLAGRSEEEAYFVRCDAQTNTPYAQEHGRVLVKVGVAVAVPLEFIEIVLVLEREQAAEVRRG